MSLVAFVTIITVIINLLIFLWCYCKVSSGQCKFSGHLVGKVVIVTGANSGIGFETAQDLAQRGARVILACRNLELGASAKRKIVASSGNENIHVLHLNLESFTSIRNFVDQIYEREKRLDVLINNAGIYSTDINKTDDGLLIGMQINYFGPFLLTSLLLPMLKQSAPSRIVNVSSFIHAFGRIDFENLNMERRSINKYQIYSNAKLCTALTTTELARRLDGSGVTVNCLHPGVVNTAIIQKISNAFIRIILRGLTPFFKNSWEGAQTTIYVAVSPEVEKVSGRYFKNCRLSELSRSAQDLDVATKLWEVSQKLVKLKA